MATTSLELPLPLSLQDMCTLRILFRVEEFPVETLALLPREIRRKLFLGLSHADLLHLDSTALFNDVCNDANLSRQTQRGPSVARQMLLDILFHDTYGYIASFLSLDLQQALDLFDALDQDDYNTEICVLEHISKSYPSLEPTLVPRGYWDSVILPTRSLQYVSFDWNSGQQYCILRLPSLCVNPLLEYCNMQTAPQKVKINCCEFVGTVLWSEYKDGLERKKEEQLGSVPPGSKVKMDPIIPFVQDFFSSVEVLELGTSHTPTTVRNLEETMVTVPYVLLYNIVTSKHPRLKHLKVYGIPMVISYLLNTVAELLCNTTESPYSYYSGTELATPAPSPYLLEGLSVLPLERFTGYPFDYMIREMASGIVSTVESIVIFQLHNLKNVAIHLLDICLQHSENSSYVNVPEYRSLLSTLTDLLKLPQVHSVHVGKSPLRETYKLIETFLCTPTTHEQSLTVEGIDNVEEEEEDNEKEEEEDEKRWAKRSITGTESKCLDLEHSSSCVHAWLFSLPQLKLKKLKMRTQDINLVPVDMDLQVEHVTFSTETYCSYRPTISPVHLEKFIVSNLALKRLEFIDPLNEYAPGLLPALNHCLSKLNQQGRGLEELQLNSVYFGNADSKEFFTHIRDLSQSSGTILILSPAYYHPYSFFSREQEKSWVLALGEEFREKKIKRIICNMRDEADPRPYLEPIADEVIVQ